MTGNGTFIPTIYGDDWGMDYYGCTHIIEKTINYPLGFIIGVHLVTDVLFRIGPSMKIENSSLWQLVVNHVVSLKAVLFGWVGYLKNEDSNKMCSSQKKYHKPGGATKNYFA